MEEASTCDWYDDHEFWHGPALDMFLYRTDHELEAQ